MKKYGLLIHKTTNIGDDIQSLATEQFLPRVDYYIPRDGLGHFRSRIKVHIIMNGWFMHKTFYFRNSKNHLKGILHRIERKIHNGYYAWPPPKCLHPLFISFHATHTENKHNGIVSQRLIRYYKEHEPIGCRDYATMNAFSSLGIEAYFSGCLTLTLKRRNLPRTDNIYFVDPFGPLSGRYYFPMPDEPEFPNELWEKFPISIRNKAHYITHYTREKDHQKRLNYAQDLIAKYSVAKLVITSRLHCALPCLALGTPVLFIKPRFDVSRFDGLIDLLCQDNIYTIEDIYNSKSEIDLKPGINNQNKIQELAESLARRCEEFVRLH